MSKEHTIQSLIDCKPLGSRLNPLLTNNTSRALFICECGTLAIVGKYKYTSGHTKSCGCWNSQQAKERFTKYFPVNRTIYACYMHMVQRCTDPNDKRYYDYGGKGVVICEEWLLSYQKFLDWSLANGWSKGLQLDKDIIGNGLLYSPETCKWVTAKENANKRKDCHYIDYNGEIKTLTEIARMIDLPYETLRGQLRQGKDIYESIKRAKELCQKPV